MAAKGDAVLLPPANAPKGDVTDFILLLPSASGLNGADLFPIVANGDALPVAAPNEEAEPNVGIPAAILDCPNTAPVGFPGLAPPAQRDCLLPICDTPPNAGIVPALPNGDVLIAGAAGFAKLPLNADVVGEVTEAPTEADCGVCGETTAPVNCDEIMSGQGWLFRSASL
jgi:hypothetical protein